MKETLIFHKSLYREKAERIFIDIFMDRLNRSNIGKLITLYKMRFPSLEEIEGCKETFMQFCIKVSLGNFQVINIVGSGGDGKNTFNISTLACFVVAGVGCKVIKHGNYGISSITGSSTLLKKLGYSFPKNESQLKKNIEISGICYLHTPLFHPHIDKISRIRKKLSKKKFFNILGPLISPIEPKKFLIGASDFNVAQLYNIFFQKTDYYYSIIHSFDGYDEISLTDNFICYTRKEGKPYSPNSVFIREKMNDENEVIGGKSIEENTNIFFYIISKKGTFAQNEVVLANTAFALMLLNKENFEKSYSLARESLKNGKAKEVLKYFLS